MSNSWNWYVYIIECKDGSYYTGCTRDLEGRIRQHARGEGSRYTRKNGFRRLVYSECIDELDAARVRERQIKDWSRAKKQKLIHGEWTQLF